MSLESAQAFVAKLASDPAFAAELKLAESAEACADLVKAAGFDFNEEELVAVRAELSDEQLDDVAAAGFFGHANSEGIYRCWGDAPGKII